MPVSILGQYFNTGCLTRRDLLVSCLLPGAPFSWNAKSMIESFRSFSVPTSGTSPQRLAFEPYQGKNERVLRMMEYLERRMADDLLGALVHGSLGEGAETAYSDFDALAIIRDEVFESPRRSARAARALHESLQIMLDFDPLQHHGWFALTEKDLRDYPEDYLPLAALDGARAMWPKTEVEINVHVRPGGRDHSAGFHRAAAAIIDEVDHRRYPRNLYQLKLLLSTFMLLPALYLQARDNQGISKKYSFEQAQRDFDESEWRIMDEVTQIRSQWRVPATGLLPYLARAPFGVSRRLAWRFSPSPPAALRQILSDDFYARMKGLAMAMRQRIG